MLDRSDLREKSWHPLREEPVLTQLRSCSGSLGSEWGRGGLGRKMLDFHLFAQTRKSFLPEGFSWQACTDLPGEAQAGQAGHLPSGITKAEAVDPGLVEFRPHLSFGVPLKRSWLSVIGS